jgi:hypothetical protein
MEETMTMPPLQNSRHAIAVQPQTMQDLLIVSSFGLWAVLLGLTPVLAFHMLTS